VIQSGHKSRVLVKTCLWAELTKRFLFIILFQFGRQQVGGQADYLLSGYEGAKSGPNHLVARALAHASWRDSAEAYIKNDGQHGRKVDSGRGIILPAVLDNLPASPSPYAFI